MPRLPHPGGDEGTWGNILNDFLSQSHASDGTLKFSIVTNAHIQPGAVTPGKLNAAAPVAGQVLSCNGTSFEWITNPSGITDHGLLSGLSDDDHPQYHTDARGDARYYTQTQINASLAGKANSSHTHAIADTAGLQAALDAKAGASHTHEASEITNLTTDLDEKAPLASPTFTGTVTLDTITITGGNPGIGKVLTSNAGGNAAWQAAAGVTDHAQLSNIGTNTHTQIDTALANSAAHIANTSNPHVVTKAQVGLANVDNTSDATKNGAAVTLTNKTISGATNTLSNVPQSAVTNLTTDLAGKAASTHAHAITDTTGLQAALDGKAAVGHTHAVARTFAYSHTGNLTVTTGTHRIYNDTGAALTITKVRASVGTAPTGADVIIDVHRDGTTIFTGGTDRPQIVAGGFTDVGVPAVTSWSEDSYLSVDIDQVGSTVAGADLTVTVVAV